MQSMHMLQETCPEVATSSGLPGTALQGPSHDLSIKQSFGHYRKLFDSLLAVLKLCTNMGHLGF